MLQPDLKEVTQTLKKLSNITYLRRSDGETLLFCTGLYGNISLLQLNGASGNNFVIVDRLCFLLHVKFPHGGLEAELLHSTVHPQRCHSAFKMRNSGLLLAGVLRKKRSAGHERKF